MKEKTIYRVEQSQTNRDVSSSENRQSKEGRVSEKIVRTDVFIHTE